MKQIISKSMALFIFCATLFAFTTKPGGEVFEIYLNNKLVIQRFGNKMNEIKSLHLNQNATNEKLRIKYNHCGRIGTNRHVTIKDNQNNVLKVYKYRDANSPMSAMMIDVKDLLNIKEGNGTKLKLYYSSSELSEGRILVNDIITDISK